MISPKIQTTRYKYLSKRIRAQATATSQQHKQTADRRAPMRQKPGVIGLGAGSLTVYAKLGDVDRMYEIDTQVIELAIQLKERRKRGDATF